mmetsp:Transcript_61385/g.192407  ORF Transcript_61385/g.192407 Transcript_61385/m.192407 type:complete len:185 (-) Transcript_61385:14-568(-)
MPETRMFARSKLTGPIHLSLSILGKRSMLCRTALIGRVSNFLATNLGRRHFRDGTHLPAGCARLFSDLAQRCLSASEWFAEWVAEWFAEWFAADSTTASSRRGHREPSAQEEDGDRGHQLCQQQTKLSRAMPNPRERLSHLARTEVTGTYPWCECQSKPRGATHSLRRRRCRTIVGRPAWELDG